MISKFTPEQAIKAILSYTNENILEKLGNKLCAIKFKELLELVKPQVIQETPKKLIDFILAFQADSLKKFINDSTYKKAFEQYANNYKIQD